MREREMRQRVDRFLQTRLRSLLLPATIGLGLGVAGCPGDALDASEDGGQTAKNDGPSADQQLPPDTKLTDAGSVGSDAGGAVALYMAQIRDAGTTLPDSGMVLRYMAQMPPDAGPDLDRVVAIYMAQIPVPRS